MRKIIVGVDVGTTGIKVNLYLENGTTVAKAYREYSLLYPKDDWVEIDPETWWVHLCECMKDAMEKGKVERGEVVAVGVTCTNALILLNEQKKAITNAFMLFDQRASAEVGRLKSEVGEEWVFARTGNRISSGSSWGPMLLWLHKNEPELLKQTKYFLVPTGYIVMRLTGMYSIDHSRATGTMLYNVHAKGWDEELCSVFQVSTDALPPIYKSHDVVGAVNAEGELASGIPAGTPVVAGAMDTVGAIVGLGVDSGQGTLIMGTVGRLCLETDVLDNRFMNTLNSDASSHLCVTPVNSTGASYKWLRSLLFQDWKASPAAHGGVKKSVFQMMDELAETVSPGAEGLLYMPYLLGERAPIWNPNATGSFIGIRIKHKQEHFIRAVLEGVGFALAHNFGILKNDLNFNPMFLHAGGGGANSEIWMQIISDMLGVSLLLSDELETEAKGAAMIAGVGIGLFPSLQSANASWIRIKRGIVPNAEAHELYKNLLPVYKELYAASQGISEKYQKLLHHT